MNAEFWKDVITRITQHEATDIDFITSPLDPRKNSIGKAVLPKEMQVALIDMPLKSDGTGTIGCRITEARDDITQLALNLAMLALENDAEVVIFSHLDYCGLERFGFRCERVTGDTQEALAGCEEQIRRYWSIDLMI